MPPSGTEPITAASFAVVTEPFMPPGAALPARSDCSYHLFRGALAMLYGNETRRVRFEEGHILIDGQPKIVLCSSLFYFRIPRGLWRQRMRAIRDAGYNCIDVYMPWNNHEPAQGRWDFGGERD